MLKKFGGTLELTEDWARHVLKSLNWTNNFQNVITTPVYEQDISKELILNLDQAPLSYVSQGKYRFDMKGTRNVPVKGIYWKRQITATFAISMPGEFLPVQVIYEGKTLRCLPKFNFPESFNTTYSENHWSNLEKSVEFLKK